MLPKVPVYVPILPVVPSTPLLWSPLTDPRATASRALFKGDVHGLNLNERHAAISTDLPRLREGKIGGVVWYVDDAFSGLI